MRKPQWTWLLVVVLALSLGCGQPEEEEVDRAGVASSELEVAIDELRENLAVTEDPEERVLLIQEYLRSFPESEYTGEVLRSAIEPLVDELQRPAEAYDLFHEVIAQLADPEIKLDAQKWGRRREAFSAAHKGWGQENLGQHEAALRTFADNADKTTYTLLGVDDTPLQQNWGKCLIRQGEPEKAMEILEIEALFGSHEAKDAYREAWVAANGSEEGLEEKLWLLRQEKAKALPQFALTNYNSKTIDTADFNGDVMLVVSWSPT